MGNVGEERIVLIDTDAGTDDALAIFVATAAHKHPEIPFRIVGITCVNGNSSVDNVCVNVTRTLEAADVTDIPIYKGCPEPMVIPYELGCHCPPYHGHNGFGDVELPPIEPKIEEENGVLAIIRLAKQYKGRLSIVALGPLTNLGMAVRLDPSIKDDIKEIYLMGGNCEGVGNTTICGEFNFIVDPESAYVTLSTYNCPIVVVPWELCKNQGYKFKDFRIEKMSPLNTPQIRLLNTIESKNLERYSWFPCDSLAVAVLVEPNLILESKEFHCTVELAGTHTRGLLAIDHDDRLGQRNNVRIVYKTCHEIFSKLLIWAVDNSQFYQL